MSFSGKVKEELENVTGSARHCQMAEAAAIVAACGRVIFKENRIESINVLTENAIVTRKYFTLLQKAFNIDNAGRFCPREIGAALKIEQVSAGEPAGGDFRIGQLVMQNTCCKRAYIRGAFLAAGSISDPEKAYHFEVVFSDRAKAEQLKNIINTFSVDAKVILRKRYYVVYVKEGSQISDLLNIMGAHVSLMEFENVRIVKEMRNSINRQVNCETANISKTVQAAAKQIDDIIYIKDNLGFDRLEEGLEEVARLRIDYPEATLKELGEMMSKPLGKSGVNHRLKRIGRIADELRDVKEDAK